MMTLMSEHDEKSDKPMKKRKFKKMILKKRMRQKAKEQAFANMHSEANDQASPEHDDSVADHEGK